MPGNTKEPRKPRGRRLAPDGWERPADFARRNHIGINQVYDGCHRGEIAHVRIGKTYLIPTDALERRLAEQQSGKSP
jgi:hypothetical protein